MKKEIILGHFMSLFAVFVWGVTFSSTKILLIHLTAIEILLYRFIVAYIFLLIIHPKFKKIESLKEEMVFLSLGLFGISFYFLLENIALKYTLASNVGLYMSTIPILTTLLVVFGKGEEKFKKEFIYGFIVAILGIFLIMFNGQFVLKIKPIGDILSILAALSFAMYSNLLKKISDKHNKLYITRKIFFYGIITALPIAFLTSSEFSLEIFLIPEVFGNILFLGIVASSMCFVMWNKAVSLIGAIKTSSYIYLIPIITIISSVIIIKEQLTVIMIVGGALTLSGVYISENGFKLIKSKKVKGIKS